MSTNFIGILLPTSPNYLVNSGFNTQLFDASGGQDITLQANASLVLTGALGSNKLRLPGNTSAWQVSRDGSTAILLSSDGSRVELAATTELQTLQFDDSSRSLKIDTSGASPQVLLGSQVLTTTAAAIAAQANSGTGNSEKLPWTLVMANKASGLFASDGTATGSDYVRQDGSYMVSYYGNPLQVNANKTAVVAQNTQNGDVYATNGSAAGTVLLASNIANPANSGNNRVVNLGSKLLFTDGIIPGINSLLTDGTVAGTAVISDAVYGIVDSARQTAWGVANTGPYGSELFISTASSAGVKNTPVKDIYPGTGSGLASGLQGALLPNGSLVFAADNGSGIEPWVSNGTDSGTFLLRDLAPGSSAPRQFTALADKVFFVAQNGQGNWGLFVTDGTTAGTQELDIAAGGASGQPSIEGVVNGVLYFSANTGASGKGFFSTKGVSTIKLAEMPRDARLLALGDDKAYFKIADASTGDELWAADLAVPDSLRRVKDLLTGSGSALMDNHNAFMAVNKLVFQAYTSSYEQGLFVSDGTALGTYQVGKGPTTETLVLGNSLVFTNSEGVFAIDLLRPTTPVPRLSAESVARGDLQADADQVFFRSSNGTLYVSQNNGPALALASQVTQFKVSEENALFFIQTNSGDSTKALWYGNGTASGTRFIKNLPASDFDFANAVAIHTPGVAAPADSTAPVFQRATVKDNVLTLFYTDANALDSNNLPDKGAFAVGGTQATVNSVAVNASAKTVTLVLSANVRPNDVVTVSYIDPSPANDPRALQDNAGNDALSLSNRAVLNLTADLTAPVFASASVSGSTLTLTYTDTSPLNSANPPDSNAFTLTGTLASVVAVAVNGTAKTVTLTLSESVKSTDNVRISYTDPTPNDDSRAIQDSAGNDAASLVNWPVVNQTADNAPPVFSSASVNGSVLALTYSDASPLLGNALDKTAFTLSGTTATINSVSVDTNGRKVLLTLSTSVKSTDSVKVAYNAPANASAAIKDSVGNLASSFLEQSVSNQTPDNVAPTLSTAVVNGSLLTLTYSDASPLDAVNIPALTAFSLSGSSATINSISVDAALRKVTLTLSASVNSTDNLLLSYTDPTANNDVRAIQDTAGNDTASFTGLAVQNQTPDNVAPLFSTATVNGNTLTISYTEANDLKNNSPASSAFVVKHGSSTVPVQNVQVDPAGKKIILTLTTAISRVSPNPVTVTYIDSQGYDTNAIQDVAGNEANSIIDKPVSNLTAPWTLLLPTTSGVYVSNAIPENSGEFRLDATGAINRPQLLVNTSKTGAIITYQTGTGAQQTSKVSGITTAQTAPTTLASNISPDAKIFNVGDKIAITNNGNTIYPGLITNITNTVIVNNLLSGIIDNTQKVIWSAGNTTLVSGLPSGTELLQADLITGSETSSELVKNIYPDSIGSLEKYTYPKILDGALLPDGKLIFAANDGSNGYEPWVSNGTAASTAPLANINATGDSHPRDFTAVNSLVIFTASSTGNAQISDKLLSTDGTITSDLTSALSVSNIKILGALNNKIYLSATPLGASSPSIYVTDGTQQINATTITGTFTNPVFLGFSGSFAYFKDYNTTATAGNELYAIDLTNHSYGQVKDIFSGADSGLVGDVHPVSVANKLVFEAWTSNTVQRLHISDGTPNGTNPIGANGSTSKITMGNSLIFAEGTALYGVNVAAATPTAVALPITANQNLLKISADTNQAFFNLANGDFYVSDATAIGTSKLSGSVVDFKLVAEDAIYFIKTNQSNGYDLYYSDGTVAGTRYIEDAPISIVGHLDNAVAIQTV